MPGFKSLTKLTWEKGKGFLKKAGTIIFAASVVIWFYLILTLQAW